jgi:hypothetical protein
MTVTIYKATSVISYKILIFKVRNAVQYEVDTAYNMTYPPTPFHGNKMLTLVNYIFGEFPMVNAVGA